MKDMLKREKKTHLEYLRSLEEEVDSQLMRAVAQARQEAELEKRALIEQTQMEMRELQAHLKLFKKFNKNSDDFQDNWAVPKMYPAVVQAGPARLQPNYEDSFREINRTIHHNVCAISRRRFSLDSCPESLEEPSKNHRLMQDWDDSYLITGSTNGVVMESDTSLQEELLQPYEWDYKVSQDDERDSGTGLSVSPCVDFTPEHVYKIIFAGDAGVGKSSFIHRLCKETFAHNLKATLGVDFYLKTIEIDNRNITLQLWDTAGQERFQAMTKTYFRRADGVILLYDITNERSFLSVRQWMQSIQEVTSIPVVLCGNKKDRRGSVSPCISTADGGRLAEDNNTIFLESSSKSGENIINAVISLTRAMLAGGTVASGATVLHLTQEEDKQEKKASFVCCP